MVSTTLAEVIIEASVKFGSYAVEEKWYIGYAFWDANLA